MSKDNNYGSEQKPLLGFSVTRRNPGHWDIANSVQGRLFRVRGGPGAYRVIDEREHAAPVKIFKTVAACMSFICDELMYELIIADGQKPQVVGSWNL